jgi:hypothetical protein
MESQQEKLHDGLVDRQAGNTHTGIKISSALVACILITVLIFAATKISGFSSFISPLVVIAGAALLFMAWRNWEFGIQALLVIVIFEGAVRKWFLPSASDLVYFYKDFIMLASIIGYLSRRNKTPLLIKGQLQILLVIISVFLVYAIASLANPSIPHPLVGLFGLKVYCLYIPLAFMVPRMFSSRQKLIDFLRWYLLLALPVIILSVAQFRDADVGSSLNRYAWNQEASESGNEASGIAAFEDSSGNTYVRVTGTFSYISGLVVYLPVVFAMLLGLAEINSSKSLPRLHRWFTYFALAAVVATAFMTGSRSSILYLAVILLIFYAFTSLKRLKGRLFQIAFGGVLVYLALTAVFPEALDAMKNRALGGDEQVAEGQGRIADLFSLPVDEAVLAGAFGYGIGTTQNSVPSLMNQLNLQFSGERIPIGYEGESSRVMLDLGVIGYLLYLLLRIALLTTLWRICLAIKDYDSKSLAVVALSVLTIYIFVGGAVVNHTQSVYQWFLVGVCFALMNAEKLQYAEKRLDRQGWTPSLRWKAPLVPTSLKS